MYRVYGDGSVHSGCQSDRCIVYNLSLLGFDIFGKYTHAVLHWCLHSDYVRFDVNSMRKQN